MKKKSLVLLLLGLIFICYTGFANAALIGVKGDLDYPFIVFGKISGAAIIYDYETGSFNVTSKDMTIKMSDSSNLIFLSGNGFETTLALNLKITLDANNKPLSSVQGTMLEVVSKGNVIINNKTYGANTTLLSGNVYKFGWGESGDALGSFDFKIKDVTGALVSDGIWPPYGNDKRETGIYLWAEKLSGWNGSWDKDFTLYKVKGNKAPIGAPPVPVPHTLLLLGSGLSLLGIVRLRRKK